MSSFTLPSPLSSNKMTWVVAGLGTLIAVYTTYWQLDNFKKRTIIKPSGARSVGVEQSTEDAIRLSTLAVLARGVNPELRTAALKILCERALKDEAFAVVLEKVEADDLARNFVGLRVLALLVQNATPRHLVRPRVFKALLDILRRASQPCDPPHAYAMRCQREAISLLSRLISLGDIAHKFAIEAGLLDWIKESRVAGYDTLFAAVFDMNRNEPIDQNLYELLNALRGRGNLGRDSLVELGLLRNGRGTTPSTGRPYELSDEDWVEVAVGGEGAGGAGGAEEPRETPEAENQEVQSQEVVVVVPVPGPTMEEDPIDVLVVTMWG